MISGMNKNRPNLGPRNPYLSQKYFKTYKNNYGNILEQYYLHIWESEILKRLESLCAKLFEILEFEVLTIWKFEILEFWRTLENEVHNIEILEIVIMNICNFESWDSGTLEIGSMVILKLKNWIRKMRIVLLGSWEFGNFKHLVFCFWNFRYLNFISFCEDGHRKIMEIA